MGGATVGHTHAVSGDDPILDLEVLLNPDEQRQFRSLCLETSAEDLQGLTEVVQLHMAQITDQDSPTADMEMAERIAGSLLSLLASKTDFQANERALIRGAVEYFLLADDASGDLDDPLGFDDDARVLNSVLGRIDRSDLAIDLD